ncbi:MAG TPA: hypothetical protein VLW17_04740 [Thermoanaerobaculaceae bacterium]|nr:hypothetical protein [Thermoanaerobaculaceae bacterium]
MRDLSLSGFKAGAAEAGPRARRAVPAAIAVAAALLASAAVKAADVLTQHNDRLRSGVNGEETVLTPANVNAATFGKLFAYAVDGAVYAQPLVMTGVAIPNRGTHNVVFVATEHDSVYAFDADDGAGANSASFWHRSFLDDAPPGVVFSPVLPSDVSSADISPEMGITSTPVIDPATGTLYVCANTKENDGHVTSFNYRLHALDVATGAEKFGGPVVISAVVNGVGDGTDQGQVWFSGLRNLQRPGLLLLNGVVYLGFGTHADVPPSHGWLMGYDAATLQQVAVINLSPNASFDSIWMDGCGPAADAAGGIYFATGNGPFDLASGGADAGDSVLRVVPNGAGFTIADYFTPYDQDLLDSLDVDLGSGGVMLMPDQPSAPTHLAVQCGKEGRIYVMDRDNLGHYDPSKDNVVQTWKVLPGCFSTPVFFNDTLFYGGSDYTQGPLEAFTFSGGQFNPQAASKAAVIFPYPGVTPSVSANGSQGGIVWVTEHNHPAVLHAYLPTDLTHELYNSNQASGGADNPGDGVKFSVPTICNGKVYVGTQTELDVYGLRPAVRRPRRVAHGLF